LSYALIIDQAKTQIILPQLKQLISQLKQMTKDHAATPMLSHTHGQRATPTTFGKEMANFTYRLTSQMNNLAKSPILGKFNGTVGNFNALTIAYPQINWPKISKNFVKKFRLEWNPYTTQIEPHDWLIEHCNIIKHCNNILIGLCRDIWGYVALDYLKQQNSPTEIGSSVMPHKINPIDFENAEGNLGIANALFTHFSDKLPISRWQRDLSDSTVMRNLGVAIGHTVLAYKSIGHGLSRLTVDKTKLLEELNSHWEVLAEAIQTIMRCYKIKTPYEQVKKLTRGKTTSPALLRSFIEKLKLPHTVRKKLLELTPENYLGLASKLAKNIDHI
jgi:adenylosuccinate lyase